MTRGITKIQAIFVLLVFFCVMGYLLTRQYVRPASVNDIKMLNYEIIPREFTPPEQSIIYASSILFSLPYGNAQNQIGKDDSHEGYSASSFAYDIDTSGNSNLLIADVANAHIKRFDMQGKFLSEIADVAASDIILDNARNIYAFDSTDVIFKFDPSGKKIDTFTAPNFRGPLNLDLGGRVYLWYPDDSVHFVNTSLRGSPKLPPFPGQVFGTDKNGNYYSLVDEVLPGEIITVIMYVNQYSPDGTLTNSFAVPVEEFYHPTRQFSVDRDGIIYQLLPLQDKLYIVKWAPMQ